MLALVLRASLGFSYVALKVITSTWHDNQIQILNNRDVSLILKPFFLLFCGLDYIQLQTVFLLKLLLMHPKLCGPYASTVDIFYACIDTPACDNSTKYYWELTCLCHFKQQLPLGGGPSIFVSSFSVFSFICLFTS